MEVNRLRWRSRRGLLELDLLLLPFFDEEFHSLDEETRQTYVRLLEQEDPDLLSWFSRKSHSDDPQLDALVQLMLKRVQPQTD
ncbi:MAG: antitoxin CptB [Candidatus Azotimanducaceae bacterium]|jgi:antitoxin CptB